MMAGIYIPGMQMPMNCCRCPCADLEYYDCNLMPGTGISSDRKSGKRLDNCPLVPVPDHGRLIDADALVLKGYALSVIRSGSYGTWRDDVPLIDTDAAPTVIPAEEGE